MLSEIWFGLFIPDPDPDFLPISDPGVKNTGSRIRNTETSPCRPRGTSEEDNGIQILLQKKAKPKSPTPLVTCQLDIFALCRIEWGCRLPFELGLPGIPDLHDRCYPYTGVEPARDTSWITIRHNRLLTCIFLILICKNLNNGPCPTSRGNRKKKNMKMRVCFNLVVSL
jgi:hypothetical protein